MNDSVWYKPGSKKRNRNGQEEKSSSTSLDQRRFAIIEIDGAGQTGRQEDRQGIKTNRWRNECDGSKTRRVAQYTIGVQI